jgi:probable HAF family extracellular repeat protein
MLALVLGMGFQPAQAGSYHLIQVPNSKTTSANGINNSNQVVGFYIDQQNLIHGFLLSNGKYTTIDYPGGVITEVDGIDDSGVMVGLYTSSDESVHGWISQNNQFTTIDYPGATDTVPMAISNTGEVVGNWSSQPNTQHMFKYVNGTFTAFDIPGATSEGVGGVDTNGDTSGAYVNSAGDYGFILRSNGQLLTIKDPVNPNGTSGSGMNNKFQAVGSYLIPGTFYNSAGFMWSSGRFSNINYPGATTTFPTAINNSDIVVGSWFNQTTSEGFYYAP